MANKSQLSSQTKKATKQDSLQIKVKLDDADKSGNIPKELHSLMLDLQEGQRKIIANQDGMKERLDKIENDFANLRDEVSCLRNDQKANTVAIQDLEGAADWISQSIHELRFEQDRQEQYSRKSSFRIFGVPEEEKEQIEDVTVKVIKDELEIEMKKEEIDIVHRTGYSRNGKQHPILVKCLSHKAKSKVMAAKKKAKTVKIHKDLAFGIKRMLMELVDRKQELELDSVWTIDGKVRYKFVGDSKIYTINSLEDYLNLTSYHK